jgi:hypothetical protein
MNGTETVARPWTRCERGINWCRRNKIEAGLVTAVIAIWIFTVVMALSVAQARKADLLRATLSSAAFAAKDLAMTTLLQLRNLSRNVDIVTADPRLASQLASNDLTGLQRSVLEICGGSQPIPFMTCYVTNREGMMVVHAPPADYMIGGDFSWRDHFQGAKMQGMKGSRAVHISKVYRGRSDNLYKFAFSAPILDSRNNFLGVIATSVTTDASMGLVFLHDDNRKVALVAPEDIDTPNEPRNDKYVVLYHPGYSRGTDAVKFPFLEKIKAMKADPSLAGQLSDSNQVALLDDNYRDPVAAVVKAYTGRWIAGFAPVGNTGFVVVVQQRFEDAVSLESSTLWNLALWSALASLVAIAILAVALRRWAASRKLAERES